ncbi:MAG TPA: hypothetical protein VGM39_25105 [Kofleriaceae bacterium]|jgi:hypothetical protein
MTSVWQLASRVAAWAPDIARDLVADAQDTDENDDARAAEILGRVFATTSTWDLAREAFQTAATAWESVDEARATAVRGVARGLPVVPFADDDAALEAELEIVARMLDGETAMPVVRRTIVELRRSLSPLRVVGQLEAALGLSPAETALIIAAAAPLLVPSFAGLPADRWEELVASSTLAPRATADRLVKLGAISQTPALIVSPPIASWLLGRRNLEHPGGVRLSSVPASLERGDTDAAYRLLVERACVIATEPDVLAGGLAEMGRALVALRPAARSGRSAIVTASIEARLHGGIPLIDLESWDGADPQIIADLAPCAVVPPRDSALAAAVQGIVAP